MACNSLKGVIQHLFEGNFIQGARAIPDSQLNQTKEELVRLQKLALDKYGIEDNLFEINHKKSSLGRNITSTTYRLDFNKEAFKKMDIEVEKQETIVGKNGQTVLALKPIEALENVYKGEIYNSKIEMENAMREDRANVSLSPSNPTYNPTNYANVVEFKEVLLRSLEKRLANAEAKRKNENSVQLKQEIAKIHALITQTSSEIHTLKTDPLVFEKTFAIFNRDLAAIDKIFQAGTPSIENINHIENLVTYFDTISNYAATNDRNNFVDVSNPSLIQPEVREQLDKLRSRVNDYETYLYDAKREYLLRAIDESQKLKSLFPSSQLEEIRDKLLSEQKDISYASLLFGTVNEDFRGQESLLSSIIRKRLEDSRNLNKGFAAGLMQKLNFYEDDVIAKLKELGYGLGVGLSKLAGEVNYDLFYQKTSKGNKSGRLINKFSHTWFTDITRFSNANREAINKAFRAGDGDAINLALVTKYSWINERADFIELGKLPEVIANPEFATFNKHFSHLEAEAYKQEIIAKIGKYEYKKLVTLQTEMVEDYLNFIRNELSSLLSAHNVTSPVELPSKVINSFNILATRHNPFNFIESHNTGQRGQVTYNSNAYQSHLKYNTYIPKKTVTRFSANSSYDVDSGYYDADFSTIEKSESLLHFWEALYDSATYMNSTLNDASTTLGHGSLLLMKKSILDTFLNQNMGALAKTGTLLRESGQTFSNLFSAKDTDRIGDEVTDVSKAGIDTVQNSANERMRSVLVQLGTHTKKIVTPKSKIKITSAPIEVQHIFERITGLSIQEIVQENGETITPSILREYLVNQAMEEQTFNLPVMMRAYLDIVSEYAAQKEALPEINIFKNLYDNIKVIKGRGLQVPKSLMGVQDFLVQNIRKQGLEDKRWRAQLRLKTWINRNVKGVTDTEIWGRFGYGDHYWKNYTAKEKVFKKELEAYKEALENRIANSHPSDDVNSLVAEIAEIEHSLQNLGQVYAMSAAWDSVVNKLSLFVGIGFNVFSQIGNRYMGYWTGMINDTGRYWKEGAFHSSNAFINRKQLRRLPGNHSYRNEIRKTKLMIEKLNTLQDATNELDRAKRNSGFRDATKVFNPFYLVEYTEWHNQVPQILAMLQSKEITSEDGTKTVPIFNGRSFPAFNIENGELVLTPEFNTEENRKTWVDFSNQESSDNKTQISQTIAMLNGDYSKTGGTYLKSKIIGRTLMMFKTWAGKQFSMRFATNQTDLALGIKDFDGAYSGSLKNPKTAVAASTVLASSALLTATMTGGLAFGGLIAGGLMGYSAFVAYKNRKEDAENFSTMRQLAAVGIGLVRKSIGLPINAIAGTAYDSKYFIEAHKAENLGLTKEEKENLQMIINELVGLLYLTLIKVMIKSFAAGAPSDDDEPKTMLDPKTGKIVPNPNYFLNPPPSKEDKELYNQMENTITRLIEDGTMWMNPSGVYTLIFRPAGIESWLLRLEKFSDAGIRLTQGTDVLTGGANKGKSKTMSTIKETFLPAILNEWSEGNFTDFGMSKKKKAEFNTNELMDKWFKSDYSKDRKEISSDRAELTEELTDYWKKELKYDDASGEDQQFYDDYISKMVREEVEVTFPLSIRHLYDENQNKIE